MDQLPLLAPWRKYRAFYLVDLSQAQLKCVRNWSGNSRDRNLLSINKRLDWGRSVDVILFC